jgi:hypothetical protein
VIPAPTRRSAATITIVDTTPPNITCGQPDRRKTFAHAPTADACDGTNVIEITSTTTNIAVPRCPGMFTVRRTWRAYDTCTNETFCSQTITLVDTPPNITCADDQIVECGNPFASPGPTAVDACDAECGHQTKHDDQHQRATVSGAVYRPADLAGV